MTYNSPRVNRDALSPFKIFGNRMTYQERHLAERYVLSNMIADLRLAEYLTLTAICHRTISYGKYFECIPQKHILHGIVSDYVKHSDGYKISRKAHSDALKSLEAKGFILTLHIPQKPWVPKFYGINYFYSSEYNERAVEFWGAFCSAHTYHGLDFCRYDLLERHLTPALIESLSNDSRQVDEVDAKLIKLEADRW
jgi:hypothetical protein